MNESILDIKGFCLQSPVRRSAGTDVGCSEERRLLFPFEEWYLDCLT